MSRFDALAKRADSKAETAQPTMSRRGNPHYRQFSAYIPLQLYRSLKVRLAESDLDLSEAVEQAITDWLQRHNANT